MKTYPDVIKEIDIDIERGIYEQFPVLKNRLLAIRYTLKKLCIVVNADGLTSSQLNTLEENDYIKKDIDFIFYK